MDLMSSKESEMSQGKDNLGVVREKELLRALQLRFGILFAKNWSRENTERTV